MEEKLVHNSNGELLDALDVPGTKVRRKKNLPYKVRGEFPVGVTKVLTEDCGRGPTKSLVGTEWDRPVAHVRVAKDYCFHPYKDTLEVVDDNN